MSNINDSYFDGRYKDIWKAIIPPELTAKEVEFMISFFNLDRNSKVLDLMCGYGRHAIALARKGVAVTAVDNLQEYIDEVRKQADGEGLPVSTVKEDVMCFRTTERFDLAICMGNSLNFFNAVQMQVLLQNLYSYMGRRGHLLINSWSLAEIAIKSFTPNSWVEVGGLKYLTSSEYLFQPTRIESNSTIISPDGNMEFKRAVDYIFSVSEMEEMLNKTGFTVLNLFSIPGRKKFTLGDPRAYIVAQKN